LVLEVTGQDSPPPSAASPIEVSSLAGMPRSRLRWGPPETASEYAAAISEAGWHMLTLLNDILEFSRLEAGEMSLSWREVALPRVVEEAMRMVRGFARTHDVRLVQEIAPGEYTVRGDAVRASIW